MKFYRLSDPIFYDHINTKYKFIKPYFDKKCLFFRNMEPLTTYFIFLPNKYTKLHLLVGEVGDPAPDLHVEWAAGFPIEDLNTDDVVVSSPATQSGTLFVWKTTNKYHSLLNEANQV